MWRIASKKSPTAEVLPRRLTTTCMAEFCADIAQQVDFDE